MKKTLFTILFFVLVIKSIGQVNSVSISDTIITKVKCYALDVKMTDIGLLNTLPINDAINENYVIIINSGKQLKSIGIGHINDKKYYDAYIVVIDNKKYYIHVNVVLNINEHKRVVYNNINYKIKQDSINNNIRVCDSILTDKKNKLNIEKQKSTLDSLNKIKFKLKVDSIIKTVKDSTLKKESNDYVKWYKSLTLKQRLAYSIIEINYCYLTVNSIGGVSLNISYTNLNKKTIRYLKWYGYVRNNVGDKVYCQVRNISDTYGTNTGPIKEGQYESCTWDCCWYNNDANVFILEKIEIIYMNRTIIKLDKSQIDFLFRVNKTNNN